MLNFNPSLRSLYGGNLGAYGPELNGSALPLGNLNPFQTPTSGFGAFDSWGRSSGPAALGSLGTGGFQMPSSQEMAQLLAEALTQGVGRKDQQAGAQNGGADLGNLMQGLMKMIGPMLQQAMQGQQPGQGQQASAGLDGSSGAKAQPISARRSQRSFARSPQDLKSASARQRNPVRAQDNTRLPRGLRPNAANGARVVREQFGFRGTIGGIGARAGKSDHPHGNAIDVMTNRDTAKGRQIAEHFRQNHQQLGVKYVIYQQQIASARNNWAWRPMADRGSPTANHMDHPHISFY